MSNTVPARSDSRAQIRVPVWILQFGLVGHDLAVYIALTGHINRGETVLTKAALAADTDCSIDTVKRSLARLRSLGLIDWQSGNPNQYELTTPGSDR